MNGPPYPGYLLLRDPVVQRNLLTGSWTEESPPVWWGKDLHLKTTESWRAGGSGNWAKGLRRCKRPVTRWVSRWVRQVQRVQRILGSCERGHGKSSLHRKILYI